MYVQTLQPISFSSNTFLHVVANKPDKIIIKVFDVNGKKAKTINSTIGKGSQQLYLNMNDLEKGSYVLNAFSRGTFLKSISFEKH